MTLLKQNRLQLVENTVKSPNSSATRLLLKGQQTKAAIVDAALSLATQIGLEGLSIGAVAITKRSFGFAGAWAGMGLHHESSYCL